MKIFLISNTQFGYKKISNNQFSYFTEKIIPLLKNKSKDDDIFIHGGNIFNNKKTVTMDIIHKTMDIFEKISKILPVYIIKSNNDELSSLLLNRIKNVNIINNEKTINNITLLSYKKSINNDINGEIIIFNNNYMNNPDLYKKILNKFDISICTHYEDKETDKNIINLGSPYQLNKSHNNKKGILIIDNITKKSKLIENNYSPKFINISINKIEDIDKLKIMKKDFIDIKVNEDIISKKENLNRLNIAINKYNFDNITYIKNKDKDDHNITINDHSFNIKEIINNYIKENNINLQTEIETVYKIYEDRNKL